MFDCCQLCYEKYVTEAGEIDRARVDAAAEKLHVPPPEHPCDCECHRDGVTVLH